MSRFRPPTAEDLQRQALRLRCDAGGLLLELETKGRHRGGNAPQQRDSQVTATDLTSRASFSSVGTASSGSASGSARPRSDTARSSVSSASSGSVNMNHRLMRPTLGHQLRRIESVRRTSWDVSSCAAPAAEYSPGLRSKSLSLTDEEESVFSALAKVQSSSLTKGSNVVAAFSNSSTGVGAPVDISRSGPTQAQSPLLSQPEPAPVRKAFVAPPTSGLRNAFGSAPSSSRPAPITKSSSQRSDLSNAAPFKREAWAPPSYEVKLSTRRPAISRNSSRSSDLADSTPRWSPSVPGSRVSSEWAPPSPSVAKKEKGEEEKDECVYAALSRAPSLRINLTDS